MTQPRIIVEQSEDGPWMAWWDGCPLIVFCGPTPAEAVNGLVATAPDPVPLGKLYELRDLPK